MKDAASVERMALEQEVPVAPISVVAWKSAAST
jgi:hypothetical protein